MLRAHEPHPLHLPARRRRGHGERSRRRPKTHLGVEISGDAHRGNFRWYHALSRQQVLDLNDFDETLQGPFEWDANRLAASATVAGGNSGFTNKQCRAATRAAMRDYRVFIAEASELGPMELHHYRFDANAALEQIARHGKKARKWKEETLSKASRKDSLRAFDKLTAVEKGRRIIVPDPPRILRIDDKLEPDMRPAAKAFYESDHARLCAAIDDGKTEAIRDI